MQLYQLQNPYTGETYNIPSDVILKFPDNITIKNEDAHFLIFIPWEESMLLKIPDVYRTFFETSVLPYLHSRTTDVHTAVCLSLTEPFLKEFEQPVNGRLVYLALCFHDSGWSKMSELEIANSLGVKGLILNETALQPKIKHALEGVKIAEKELRACKTVLDLSDEDINLILKMIEFHDKPEEVSGLGNSIPIEMQILVDLDHIWSFTHENFWQDVIRKGVKPNQYVKNLGDDLDSYFVTTQGKSFAQDFLREREKEVDEYIELVK